jgi:hypothetical protein
MLQAGHERRTVSHSLRDRRILREHHLAPGRDIPDLEVGKYPILHQHVPLDPLRMRGKTRVRRREGGGALGPRP